MKNYFKPFPADSAGLITNYKCTFQCEHCLYCSSPKVEEEIDEDRLMKLVDELSLIPDLYLHIGGGEPLLYGDRLKRIVSYIRKKSVFLEYVETNGFLLLKDTEKKLKDFKEAGINRFLLSISPFHNEFISAENIKRIYNAIISASGYDGIFPWHPGYFRFLERVSPDKPVKLEEYFKNFSLNEILYQLTSVMYIQAGGRAAYLFSEYMELSPPERLFHIDCIRHLSSPVHAHIDYRGNYITGFCSGLRTGEESAIDLRKLYKEGINLEEYPLLSILTGKGLKGLYNFALNCGYRTKKEGYVAPCHLCLDIRIYLYFNKEKYRELYPSFFYEEFYNKLNSYS